jgi:hypothetical protein
MPARSRKSPPISCLMDGQLRSCAAQPPGLHRESASSPPHQTGSVLRDLLGNTPHLPLHPPATSPPPRSSVANSARNSSKNSSARSSPVSMPVIPEKLSLRSAFPHALRRRNRSRQRPSRYAARRRRGQGPGSAQRAGSITRTLGSFINGNQSLTDALAANPRRRSSSRNSSVARITATQATKGARGRWQVQFAPLHGSLPIRDALFTDHIILATPANTTAQLLEARSTRNSRNSSAPRATSPSASSPSATAKPP